MAKKKFSTYDPAEDLGSAEAIAVFMAEAFGTNDAAYISHALGVVARAKGMAQNCGADGAVARAALPVVQQEGQSDAEDDAGGDAGAGDRADGEDGGVKR